VAIWRRDLQDHPKFRDEKGSQSEKNSAQGRVFEGEKLALCNRWGKEKAGVTIKKLALKGMGIHKSQFMVIASGGREGGSRHRTGVDRDRGRGEDNLKTRRLDLKRRGTAKVGGTEGGRGGHRLSATRSGGAEGERTGKS